MRGKLRLERPTQVLHYEFETTGATSDDVVDIKLHRGATGPVIELLGNGLAGAVSIPNDELDPLLGDELYVVIYSRDKARGHGQIIRR